MEATFLGPFKMRDAPEFNWHPEEADHSHFQSFMSSPTPTCLVELLSPFAASRLGADLARQCFHASSLYLSTDYGVARLDTQQRRCLCDCHLCLATGDFYCGWDSRRGECTAAPNKNPRASYWEQEEPRCPDLFAPVSPVSFSPSPTLYVRSSILSPLLTYPD